MNQNLHENKRLSLATKGQPPFRTIGAARLFAGFMPVQSSFLFSLVRRYFLELSLSTTGHLYSPWKRLLQNYC
ncbi:hypothetical protein SPIRO4BDMA_50822 [uncultured spirochete]|uniref:Uncharacterized protein n=1 Tax=uncultured spirochete TaxID=156406 RepID=A0A3P3XSP3_9SPIR|nr:hypothetical protein SPIRO4BDMA_50822 [uncultured spirochete]